MVPVGTRNETEYTAIVTQLRSAWDDRDLRDRDRGSKSFGKGNVVHFAEASTEWYAERIAHSISGDAAELEVTWSFDLAEAIWCCGVLDPSIPEPDVMDWSKDWSCHESSPCAEDVFPGQRTASCLSHATAEQKLNVSSACLFGLSRHSVSQFLSARKSCANQLTPNVVHLVKTCASHLPSSQSCVRLEHCRVGCKR